LYNHHLNILTNKTKKKKYKKKTRIFATNTMSFLSQCDKIIMLDNGVIVEEGEYDELIEKSGSFAGFIRSFLDKTNNNDGTFFFFFIKLIANLYTFILINFLVKLNDQSYKGKS
jgi:ABC-type multidrug transport system ATPase subunit